MKPMLERLEDRGAPASAWQDTLGVLHVDLTRRADVAVLLSGGSGGVGVWTQDGALRVFQEVTAVRVDGRQGRDLVIVQGSVPLWARRTEALILLPDGALLERPESSPHGPFQP